MTDKRSYDESVAVPVTGGSEQLSDGRPRRQPGRLAAWCLLVSLLAAAAYAARFADAETPADLLYLWSTFVGAVIQYGVMFVLVLAIARGLDRGLLGLELPVRRKRAALLGLAALVVIVAAAAALSPFLDAGDEQGLVPQGWDSSRVAPFLANAAVVTIVAPLVEELLYRGLGLSLLAQFMAPWTAILISGVAFGLAHGLVLGLPVLTIFGITLGWLRLKTGSVYPGMIVHFLFNAAALAAGAAT